MKKNIWLFTLLIIASTTNTFSQKTYYKNGKLQTSGNKQNGEYVEYDGKGNIKLKTNFLNGKENGEQLFYENEKLVRKEKFKNGKAVEEYSYYKSGQLKEKTTDLNNDGYYEAISYFESGGIEEKGNRKLVNHLREDNEYEERKESVGEWIQYYETGQIAHIQNYDNGKNVEELVVKELKYDEVGQLFEKRTAQNKKSESVNYYSVGSLKSIFKNDGEGGEEILRYYETGQLEEKITEIDGNKNFTSTRYYPNGQIKEVKNLVNGKKNGESIYYSFSPIKEKTSNINAEYKYIENHSNGQLTEKHLYKNNNGAWIEDFSDVPRNEMGEIMLSSKNDISEYRLKGDRIIESVEEMKSTTHENGEWVEFYENGQIRAKGNFVNGKKNGEWIVYYTDGSVYIKGHYLNGDQNGEWVTFYKNGNSLFKRNFINGVAKGEFIDYFSNGQIYLKTNIISKNDPTVEMLEYFSNGQLKIKQNVNNGRRNGECIAYYANGQLAGKANMIDGKLSGESVEYYYNGQLKKKCNYILNNQNGGCMEYDFKESPTKLEPTRTGFNSVEKKPEIKKPEIRQPQANKINSPLETRSSENTTTTPEILSSVEEYPEFPGGESELQKFIQDNLTTPQSAIDNGYKGKCFLKFVVTPDGSITNVIVTRGVSNCPDCDNEAKRIMSIMPKWKPGKNAGKTVYTMFTTIVKF